MRDIGKICYPDGRSFALTAIDRRHAMARKIRPPRERAARALCELHGHPPDIKMEGHPMWMSYLEEVDTVLKAALIESEWEKLKNTDM